MYGKFALVFTSLGAPLIVSVPLLTIALSPGGRPFTTTLSASSTKSYVIASIATPSQIVCTNAPVFPALGTTLGVGVVVIVPDILAV